MPTTIYPGALDVFVDPTPATLENVVSHAAQHAVANDAILQLETKLGINKSVRTQTIVTNVTTNQAITPDLSQAQVFRYNLSANVTTINPPINAPAGGAMFTLQFIQDSNGGHVYGGFTAAYNTSNIGLFPSPAPNSVDTCTFYWDGTTAWTVSASNQDIGWTAVSFQNSWTNIGGAFRTAQYRKVGSDVTMRGTIVGGATGTVCTTLPVGYRPSATVQFTAVTALGAGVLLVGADGTVTPNNSGGGQGDVLHGVALDLIRFSLYP